MEIQGQSLQREAKHGGSSKHSWSTAQQLAGVTEALQDCCACVQRGRIRFSFFTKISRKKNKNTNLLPLSPVPYCNTNSLWFFFCPFSLRYRAPISTEISWLCYVNWEAWYWELLQTLCSHWTQQSAIPWRQPWTPCSGWLGAQMRKPMEK